MTGQIIEIADMRLQQVPAKKPGYCYGCEMYEGQSGRTCREVNVAARAVGLTGCTEGGGGKVYVNAAELLTEGGGGKVYVNAAELLTEDPDHGDPAVSLTYKPSHGGYPEGPAMPLASDQHRRVAALLVSQAQQFDQPRPAVQSLAAHKAEYRAAVARTTDPEPSHKAAASVGGGKLVDLILVTLQQMAEKDKAVGFKPDGMTGKELSQHTGRPLNSITPRLAPMRRAGYIHADGTRNRETVWKLGNGVKA